MCLMASITLLGLTCWLQPVSAENHGVDARKKAKRVVLISLDGITVDGLSQANTPNIDALLTQGVLSVETRVQMPSVTLPNWTCHLTGSGPEQHGVTNNNWTLKNIKLPPVVQDAEGYYPSVFQVLKDEVKNMKTAFYYNWKELIYPYNQRYIDEVSFEENDGYKNNYQKAFKFLVANKKQPTLVFLYSVHTDHAGHGHKWMSKEYIQSIEEADVAIGEFLQNMKEAELYDSTHFLFLTDHGGVNYGHGGVSTKEMIVPWGITGPGIAKGLKMTEPNNTINTSTVVLRLFDVKQPDAWIGKVPYSIFRRSRHK